TDILSRMKRMQGYEVLHPMGWDAFGLPAEQYALDTGNSPAEFTKKNIATFKRQIQELGFSYDWDREISTTDPQYYKRSEERRVGKGSRDEMAEEVEKKKQEEGGNRGCRQ